MTVLSLILNYCGSWEAADQNQLLWFMRGSWSESIIVVHERQLIRINYCGSWEAADQNQFKPQSHYSLLLTFYSSFRFIFLHWNRKKTIESHQIKQHDDFLLNCQTVYIYIKSNKFIPITHIVLITCYMYVHDPITITIQIIQAAK
jgi:hypothetical protein